MVDIHNRLESAEDMVAQMIAAEMMPTMAPGAWAEVTAIMHFFRRRPVPAW